MSKRAQRRSQAYKTLEATLAALKSQLKAVQKVVKVIPEEIAALKPCVALKELAETMPGEIEKITELKKEIELKLGNAT